MLNSRDTDSKQNISPSYRPLSRIIVYAKREEYDTNYSHNLYTSIKNAKEKYLSSVTRDISPPARHARRANKMAV